MNDPTEHASPWQPFLAELIGTALLVLVGLSLVILMFGTAAPIARLVPRRRPAAADHGFPVWHDGRPHRAVPGGKGKRGAYQPCRHARILADGQARPTDRPQLCPGAVGRRGAGLPAAPGLGRDGPERGLRRDAAGRGYASRTVLMGEVDHDVRHGRRALPLSSGFAGIRPFTPAMFPFLYAIMVYPRSADIGHQHESRAQPRAGHHLRRNGRAGGFTGSVR